MHGPEVLLAGEKRTTAKSSPALPEMRPAAIWHEGIQLILLTFPLGNKCLEIIWPQAFDQRKIHSQKEPPAPIRQIRGLGARNQGMALKTRRGVCRPRAQQTGRPGKGTRKAQRTQGYKVYSIHIKSSRGRPCPRAGQDGWTRVKRTFTALWGIVPSQGSLAEWRWFLAWHPSAGNTYYGAQGGILGS